MHQLRLFKARLTNFGTGALRQVGSLGMLATNLSQGAETAIEKQGTCPATGGPGGDEMDTLRHQIFQVLFAEDCSPRG